MRHKTELGKLDKAATPMKFFLGERSGLQLNGGCKIGADFMCQTRDRQAVLEEHEIKAIMMVQGIITRMADNSQKCKTFFLTLCGAVVALVSACKVPFSIRMICLFCALSVTFWFLDARYLQLERKFRQHHKAIIEGTVPYLDQWNINLSRYNSGFWSSFFSFSELLYPVACITISAILLI